MTGDATLVERLKNWSLPIAGADLRWPIIDEAAARITALEAENAALRERMTWRPITVRCGGQAIALDENGEEGCAFYDYHTEKWYRCSNVVDSCLAFTPQKWMPLPAPPAMEPGA